MLILVIPVSRVELVLRLSAERVLGVPGRGIVLAPASFVASALVLPGVFVVAVAAAARTVAGVATGAAITAVATILAIPITMPRLIKVVH